MVCQERENPHLELYQEQNYVAASPLGWGAEATFDLKDYRHGAPKKLSNESPSLSIQTVECRAPLLLQGPLLAAQMKINVLSLILLMISHYYYSILLRATSFPPADTKAGMAIEAQLATSSLIKFSLSWKWEKKITSFVSSFCSAAAEHLFPCFIYQKNRLIRYTS